jgi:4-hydroxy-tetrahydrodipicolinate synthase
MVGAVDDGDLVTARRINDQLLPAVCGLMTHTQGAITAKASLQLLGQLENRTVRPPLVDATDDEITMLRDELRAAHLLKD